jgi:hypothetical protein
MLRLIFVLLVIFSITINANAYTITAETNPKLGTTNLFDNGDAETGTYTPDNWSNLSLPPVYVVEWSDFAFTGKKSVYTKVTGNTFNGYWKIGTSNKRVPAEQELLFSYWINMPWGVAEPYVYGYYEKDPQNMNAFENYSAPTGCTTRPNPLYPVFIKNANYFKHKLLRPGWNRISLKIGKRPKVKAQDIGSLLLLKPLTSKEGKVSECWIDRVYYGMQTVNLNVKIEGDISKIKEVQILNEVNELSYSTTDIPKSGEFTIPVLADSKSYKILVKDTDGKEENKIIE